MDATLGWFIAICAFIGLLSWQAQKKLGISLRSVRHAPALLTSMAAKFACSARHISGFAPAVIFRDLRSYSPAYGLIRIDYRNNKVTASLGGRFQRSATFRPGLGCSLETWPDIQLNPVNLPAINSGTGPWPVGEDAPSVMPSLQSVTDQLLEEDRQAGLDTRALVVVHRGQLVAESYAAFVTPATPLLGWSMAKSLTAILLGRMEALGLTDVHCNNLFPQWALDARREITLQHLLQMCSGLRFDETYAAGSDATRMLFAAPSASDYALQSPLEHKPGRHFSYSSGTSNLLARWMHQRLGGTQACLDFLHQELLKPLNMAHTVFETDASGVLVGSSYAYASGRDWARLGLLLLNNGASHGGRLLSEDWVHRARTANSSSNEPGYGYQLWLNCNGPGALRYPELPADAYFMFGNHEQKLMVAPGQDTVILRIGWTGGEYPMARRFNLILDQLTNY